MEPDNFPARWGVVRAEWMFNPQVGVDELAMMACLSTYLDKQGYCWPSQQTLATRLKKSRPWVIKVLNRLVEIGLVERTRRERKDGGLRSCLYRIVPSGTTGAAEVPDAPAGLQHGRNQAPPERDRGCHAGDTSQTQTIQESPSLQGVREAPRESRLHSAHPGPETAAPHHSPARPLLASPSQARPVPKGWCPSDADLAWAASTHPDMDAAALTRAFVNTSRAKGYSYIDYGCAWRGWFENQQRWKEEPHDRFIRNRQERPSSRGCAEGPSQRPAQRPAGGTSRLDRTIPERTGPKPGLAERNGAAADACLERILARRAGGGFAGFSSV